MEQVFIRNIFAISFPFKYPRKAKTETLTRNDSFGFQLHDQKSDQIHKFNLELYVDNNGQTRQLTNWASWGGNPVSLKKDETNQNDSILLQLRINHGVFDFRTLEGPQEARLSLDYYLNDVFVQRAVSSTFQILPKPRTSSSRQPYIELNWQENAVPQTEVSSMSDNERLASENVISLYEHGEPEAIAITAELQLLSGSNSSIQSIEQAFLQHRDEQYMVLYNGSAEVIGNFRALNFYKASDVNIKEDIRLLPKDIAPRDVLLQIDGVAYRFKQGVSSSVNKRFVGFIAQQVESVVPEAVQLIDGILHVDYESLLPFMNESIRANFIDLQDIKTKNETLKRTLDQIYNEFVTRDEKRKHYEKNQRDVKVPSHKSQMHPVWKGLIALFALVVLVLVSALGILYVHKQHSPVSPTEPPPSAPIETPVSSPPIPEDPTPPNYRIMKEFYYATDGPNWLNNMNWLNMSVSECNWHGIDCSIGFSMNLNNNLLRGTIPPSLGKRLWMDVDLSNNQLSGTIPSEVFSAVTGSFVVAHNNLTGTISSIIGTYVDAQFDGSHNRLTGTLPSYLPTTVVVNNNLLEGPFPQFLADQPRSHATRTLNVAYNNLSGDVNTLSNLTDIVNLNITHNINITGNITLNTYQLNYIRMLDLSYTNISRIIDGRTNPPVHMGFFSCDLTHVPFQCPLPDWAYKFNCNATCTNSTLS